MLQTASANSAEQSHDSQQQQQQTQQQEQQQLQMQQPLASQQVLLSHMLRRGCYFGLVHQSSAAPDLVDTLHSAAPCDLRRLADETLLDLLDGEMQVRTADDGAVEVGDRILPRIFLFSGVPVVLGLASLPGFAYLNNVRTLLSHRAFPALLCSTFHLWRVHE